MTQPMFSDEGEKYYDRAYAHNRPFATAGPYTTQLSPDEEKSYRQWVRKYRVPDDPDAKRTDYDMRGYWRETHGAPWSPTADFPDTYKTPYDTTFSRESKYASKDNPFSWSGDKLIDRRNGQLIFDRGTTPGLGATPAPKPPTAPVPHYDKGGEAGQKDTLRRLYGRDPSESWLGSIAAQARAAQYGKSVTGQPYESGKMDCSGFVAKMVQQFTGKAGPVESGNDPNHPMSTWTEAEWLKSMGLKIGAGPPGSLRVGWETYSDAGGHTAMTMPDGTNVESSGSGGVQYGGKARGASDPMFTVQAYLPMDLPGRQQGGPAPGRRLGIRHLDGSVTPVNLKMMSSGGSTRRAIPQLAAVVARTRPGDSLVYF